LHFRLTCEGGKFFDESAVSKTPGFAIPVKAKRHLIFRNFGVEQGSLSAKYWRLSRKMSELAHFQSIGNNREKTGRRGVLKGQKAKPSCAPLIKRFY
jgi:hypothetical protein